MSNGAHIRVQDILLTCGGLTRGSWERLPVRGCEAAVTFLDRGGLDGPGIDMDRDYITTSRSLSELRTFAANMAATQLFTNLHRRADNRKWALRDAYCYLIAPDGTLICWATAEDNAGAIEAELLHIDDRIRELEELRVSYMQRLDETPPPHPRPGRQKRNVAHYARLRPEQVAEQIARPHSHHRVLGDAQTLLNAAGLPTAQVAFDMAAPDNDAAHLSAPLRQELPAALDLRDASGKTPPTLRVRFGHEDGGAELLDRAVDLLTANGFALTRTDTAPTPHRSYSITRRNSGAARDAG